MNQSILDLRTKLDASLAAVAQIQELEALKVEYLGKKGSVTALMTNMGSLSPEEKKTFGKEVNELKDYATEAIAQKFEALQQLQLQKELDAVEEFDLSIPPPCWIVALTTPSPWCSASVRKCSAPWALLWRTTLRLSPTTSASSL